MIAIDYFCCWPVCKRSLDAYVLDRTVWSFPELGWGIRRVVGGYCGHQASSDSQHSYEGVSWNQSTFKGSSMFQTLLLEDISLRMSRIHSVERSKAMHEFLNSILTCPPEFENFCKLRHWQQHRTPCHYEHFLTNHQQEEWLNIQNCAKVSRSAHPTGNAALNNVIV